jgi:phosphoglycerate dehydrogenase-like enzyme
VNILVLIHSPFRMWTIPDEHVAELQRAFPSHRFLHARDDREGLEMIPRADAAFCSQIQPEHLQAAPRLRWIHSPAAGVGGMLYPAMQASDIVVTNGRGMSGDTIAEHVVAVTLALFRRLPLAIVRQREKQWAQDELGASPGNRMLRGAHVLVIGLGAIGEATAVHLHAFGARVTAVRRRIGAPMPPGVDVVRAVADLPDLLPHADVVVIAAPQTKMTRGMIGAAEIARMKRDAVIVNVSRGGLIDEDALTEALQSGRLGGAALDVFRHEPLGVESPLWNLPNVIITPHTSGFRPDHWDAATALFAENLRRFERGEPLLNVVDKEAGY